jgi:hypothetical protein
MSDVVCQQCGTVSPHTEAKFFGPPYAVTWLCERCARVYQPMTLPSYQRGPIRVEPISNVELPAQSVEGGAALTATGEHAHSVAKADDIHRLRFELAHVVKYFSEHEVPEELIDWHFKAKLLLSETSYARPDDNTGKPWNVEE